MTAVGMNSVALCHLYHSPQPVSTLAEESDIYDTGT